MLHLFDSFDSKNLSKVLSLADFEVLAQRRLPRPLYAYVSGGCEENLSMNANRDAYAEYEFKTRVLVDVSSRSQNISLLGRDYDAPFGIAPMGITALTSYRGDLVLADAARQANIPAIMSGSSLIKMEEVCAAAPRTWFQAYLPGNLEQIDALISRVKEAGFKTLVITVDVPMAGNRENNIRAGFSTPLRPSVNLLWQGATHPRWSFGVLLKTLLRHGMPHFENNYATRGVPIISRNVAREFSDRGHLTWKHIEHIRKCWSGHMVLKGILNPLDAELAGQRGIDAIIVSNHGERQLDGAAAPLHVLSSIIDTFKVGPVMIDGGITRGSQVLKALALGAACVFIGRPFNYAATVAGLPGVLHAIDLLKTEVSRDMAMLGLQTLMQLNADYLLHRSK
jgi:L-lactate dehydrogenase (cytochrome)